MFWVAEAHDLVFSSALGRRERRVGERGVGPTEGQAWDSSLNPLRCLVARPDPLN